MTKVLQINSLNVGSTGNIMANIDIFAKSNNMKSYIAYPASRTNKKNKNSEDILIGNKISRNLSILLGYLSGFNDFFNIFSTLRFIKTIKKINPDIIHFHNLHGNYINLPFLLRYINMADIPVVWTLHDCWVFTGGSAHFDRYEKLDDEVYYWSSENNYPKTLYNNQKRLFRIKRKLILDISNITFVTPSLWLKKVAKTTYLNKFPIKVINNGIDLNDFKYRESNLRRELNLKDKIVILGVSSVWNKNKGLEIFINLSKKLNSKYKILLVGVTNREGIPEEIITVPRVDSKIELSKFYSMADIFINPSFYETMGMVSIESLACGTPVIASNRTAVPEFIAENTGFVVENNISDEYYEIITSEKWKKIKSRDCIKWASEFSYTKKYEEYLSLYNSISV